jgi:hypothetical protein
MSNVTPQNDYQTLQVQIADWANRQDWQQALVASFISMAEQKLNAELRVDRMIETDQALITGRCAQLPDDWLEMDFVSIANSNAANGWLPIRYKARDEFFNLVDNWAYGYYTIEGRQIIFGGPPDAINGVSYLISYYGEVPVMATEGTSWLYTKYPSLYLYASLMHADLHAVGEEANAGAMKQLAEDMIAKLNNEHLRAKASGSRLKRSRIRSFG